MRGDVDVLRPLSVSNTIYEEFKILCLFIIGSFYAVSGSLLRQ